MKYSVLIERTNLSKITAVTVNQSISVLAIEKAKSKNYQNVLKHVKICVALKHFRTNPIILT